jgi:L-threonine kinase
MASSSADIAAACAAAARALHISLTPDDIKDIALSVEPTDGVFFPGVVALDHIRGGAVTNLGAPPPMRIAIWDFGGQVDTLLFNRRRDLVRLRREAQGDFAEAYALIKDGLSSGNSVLIGKGATISALANQKILPKDGLEKLILIAHRYGAVGVNVAHSGTVAGILFDGNELDGFEPCREKIAEECPELRYLGAARLISGGML